MLSTFLRPTKPAINTTGGYPVMTIEAAARCVKHLFKVSQLPVRGSFRMACLLIGSAAKAYVCRIQHYLDAQIQSEKLP